MKCGDDLLRPDEDRHVVAVVGDGAFPCGMVFEAMNNAGGLKKNLIVILNDNKMSICPRVGGLAESLDRLRMANFYTGLKAEVQKMLNRVPVIGDPVERFISQVKDAIKAGLLGGMIFEDLGFRYIGPVDGHNIRQLQKYLNMVRQFQGPVLLHVVTEKGHGFQPAAEDPTTFHAPAPFERHNGSVVPVQASRAPGRPTPSWSATPCSTRCEPNPKVVVITAAMCQGNMLEPVRDEFPDRFFDVGICESHAVAFAAGLAKAGLRPIVDIYSTFMQRAYDQIFQEVALQNLPVAAADGPRRAGRARRPDAPRRVRPDLLAAAAEPDGDGPRRRRRRGADARLGPAARRARRPSAIPRRPPKPSTGRPCADRIGQGRSASTGAATAC